MLHDYFYFILFFPYFGVYYKIIVFPLEKKIFFEMFGETTINLEILGTFQLLNPTLIQNPTPAFEVHSLVRERFEKFGTLSKYAMYQFFFEVFISTYQRKRTLINTTNHHEIKQNNLFCCSGLNMKAVGVVPVSLPKDNRQVAKKVVTSINSIYQFWRSP